MLKFFRLPFATTGDKTAVPDAVDSNGNVSYSQGYGFDYQRQKTDPAAKNIERDKMNQILFDVTTAIAELQSQGAPDYITSALNGGTAYSYAQYAIVKYSGALYISLVAANTALPSDATKWALLPTPALLQQSAYMSANAGGTVDAITAAFTPAIPALVGGTVLRVRATGANTSAAPTFTPNSGVVTPKAVCKGAGAGLLTADIIGAGSWIWLQYDATLDKWILLNPAYGTDAVTPTNDPTYAENTGKPAGTSWVRGAMSAIATAAGFVFSLSAVGYIKFPSWLGGWIVQWTAGASTAAAGNFTVNLPVTFPNAHFRTVVAPLYASGAQSGTIALVSATTSVITVARGNTDNGNAVTPVIISVGY